MILSSAECEPLFIKYEIERGTELKLPGVNGVLRCNRDFARAEPEPRIAIAFKVFHPTGRKCRKERRVWKAT